MRNSFPPPFSSLPGVTSDRNNLFTQNAGKTTLALAVTARLNAAQYLAHPNGPPLAVYLPMDGFHMTRAQLRALPNAEEAFARRGAPWTFNAGKFLDFVKAVKNPTSRAEPVLGPSFDHALKDPVEDDISVDPAARIVVFEGLYLSLGRGLWKEVGREMDELWFLEVARDVATERVVERHVLSGVCDSREEAVARATGSDSLNADEIIRDRVEAHEVIHSMDDAKWKSVMLGDE